MDAIILAGGRGRRMGALTAHCNKGALSYRGKPSIVRTLERVCAIPMIGTVYVATSYRNDTIHAAVSNRFSEHVASGKIRFSVGENIVGDLKRIVTTLVGQRIEGPCFVCGIDVIMNDNGHETERLLQLASGMGKNDVAVVVSPRTHLAPTHSQLLVEDGIVRRCVRPLDGESCDEWGWYVNLTNYVLGEDIVDDLRMNPPEQSHGSSRTFDYAWRRGGTVRALTMDTFVHLGNGRDFGRIVP
jgi:NDP-sugar pyrophosphorylase family protein